MTKHRLIPTIIGSAVAALALGACGGGDDGAKTTAQGETQKTASSSTTPAAGAPNRGLPQGSEPSELDPADFSIDIDNPYWPMRPGSRWVYSETDTEGTREKVVVEVTDRTKMIANGVEARVIRDTVSEAGRPVEITDDWYAQDNEGNIWYLGEAVRR